MFATQRNLSNFYTFRRDAGILGILNHRNQRLQLLRSKSLEFLHNVCISEIIRDAKLKTIKYPNGTRTHSGIKWILSSISYPTFFPQLPQNATKPLQSKSRNAPPERMNATSVTTNIETITVNAVIAAFFSRCFQFWA